MAEEPVSNLEINPTEDQKTDFGLIRPRSIYNEMSESYLDYAMSVIVARALPDVRDGLKPVQRRVLYTMRELGLTPGAKHQKSAKIIGLVMGSYHPHGDMAIYDSMARMAQWWSLKLPLVNGQGNFGSMDGDPPAAMRYTEARMSPAAEYLLMDIDKETVDWRENYDGTRQEPVVLPARLPNLLINGSQGIAVGMASNIPPHNINEVIEALLLLMDEPEAELDKVIDVIKGPDFPTGGIIYDQVKIKEALSTGRGGIIIRGQAEIEEEKNRSRIIITELPYQTNKATFITHIAELVKSKKIEGISDIRDETDRQAGVRVVIDLKAGATASKILNQLYSLTELQSVVHYNLVALTEGIQPRLMNIVEVLNEFIAYRIIVVTRRTEYELKVAKAKAHILEGLKIALDHLDAIIKLIRQSKDRDDAKKALQDTYKLSELQANAILDMRLSQLANLERQKVYDDYEAITKVIADLEDILAKPERITKIIKAELAEVKEKFGKERQTKVEPLPLGDFSAIDLIPEEQVLITLTAGNYIKRLPPDTYRSQLRGGKGVIGMSTREEDSIQQILSASSHDQILFFTQFGRVFKVASYEIPATTRQSKGVALPNLINIQSGEKVTAMLAVGNEDDNQFLFFATKKGLVKRVASSQFAKIRRSGVNAIDLKKDDQLLWVRKTDGRSEIAEITRQGQVIVFNESEARAMGRNAAGVRGIRLKAEDEVIEVAVLTDQSQSVCVISEKGIGKRVELKQFRHQHRGGSGIRIARLNSKTGLLSDGSVIDEGAKDMIIASTSGQVLRININSIKTLSRQASGVILIRLNGSDKVSSISVVNDNNDWREKKPRDTTKRDRSLSRWSVERSANRNLS